MIFVENENSVRRIITYMSARGITDKGISGILGNWFAESNFFSNNLQNAYNTRFGMSDDEFTKAVDEGTFDFLRTDVSFGYGFAQWTSIGRRTGLYNLVKTRGVSIADEEAQLDWAWEELNSKGYKSVLDVLMDKTSTVADCAEIVVTRYEKPGSVLNVNTRQATIDRRVDYAKEFYRKYFLAEGETTNMENTNTDTKKTVIAINAGHWLGNTTRRVPSYMSKLALTPEFTLNQRVVEQVVLQLSEYDNVSVCLNYDVTGKNGKDGRGTDATTNGLNRRIYLAEEAKANIYLSIHHNGGIKGGTGGGTVVYYYAGNARNQRQATSIYNNIKARTGLVGNRSTPVKGDKSYIEINKPTMDSFIIECAFMDSKSDIEYIARNEWPAQVAGGIVAFLVSEYGLTKTTKNVKEEDNTSSNIYKVSITSPVAIYEKTDAIAPAGTYTIVGTEAGMGRLKSGAGWICLSNATKG